MAYELADQIGRGDTIIVVTKHPNITLCRQIRGLRAAGASGLTSRSIWLGLGPDGHAQSICHIDLAERAQVALAAFCKAPGPIAVGAVQRGAVFRAGL